ncbi:hypothetical protein M1D88_13175 [Arthrobacter sp. R1-13]
MTDQTGLTDPGKEERLPGSGMLLFAAVGWLVSAMIWLYVGFQTQNELQLLYGVLVLLSLVLAVGSFVEWRKSKKRTGESGTERDLQ